MEKARIFVFIDALGWKQVEKYGFLNDLLPHRNPVEMQFGYSCTAIPTILSGKRPAEHGHLAFYDWAPAKSPFRKMRFLAPLLKPDSFWRRGRVRNVLSRLVKRLYGFTGYFQLYAVPLAHLPCLDYCEKRDMFVPGGLGTVKNLADVWREQGLSYHISDWRRGEDANFRVATELARTGRLDRAFVYAAAFDALQHDNVGRDEVLKPAVARYERLVRGLYDALAESGRDFELTVFSDHGMTALTGTADIGGALAGTGLVWGRDYASAVDSTLARFWWLKPGAREKVEAAMAGLPGRWLSDDEQRGEGIYRDDRKFGDAIWLAPPGVQFIPSDMGVKPLNGMHGYDPKDVDSLACWLSTGEARVAKVADYFGVMTAR